MHVNMSLVKDGKNAFYDAGDKNGLSKVAYQFIAGIIEHIKGMTAITNPLVNSYKRLVPGYEAPVYIAWSAANRSPLIRIPASRGNGTRIELRNPDPSCNPYLCLAVCLAAGLDGIRRKLTPPDGVDLNVYKLTDEEREQLNIESLPENLKEAVNAFKNDNVIREAVGEHVYKKYIRAKMREWEKYSTRVSQWELEEYLGNY